MKQLRRQSIDAALRASQCQLLPSMTTVRAVDQSVPLSEVKSSAIKARLSTPMRTQNLDFSTSKPPSSHPSSKTPMEIRWPLAAFFRKHQYGHNFIQMIENDTLENQLFLLADLQEIEDLIAEVKNLENRADVSPADAVDYAVVNELKSQYVKAALQSSNAPVLVENLRACLVQYLNTAGDRLRQRNMLPAIMEEDGLSPYGSPSFGEVKPLDCNVTLSQTPTKSQEFLTMRTPLRHTPMRRTPFAASVRSVSVLSTPSVISKNEPGDTPLDVMRRRLLTLKRLQLLRHLTANDQDPTLLIQAQAFVEKLDKTYPTSGSKRRLGLSPSSPEASTKKRRVRSGGEDVSTSGGSAAPNGTESSSADDSVNDSSATQCDTQPSFASQPEAQVSSPRVELLIAQPATQPAESHIMPGSFHGQPKVQAKKIASKGAALLLGSKAVQTSKKRYVSRVAATQKAKFSRETRAIREALHAENGHSPANKTKRQRRLDKFKKLNQEKFVVEPGFDLEALKTEFRSHLTHTSNQHAGDDKAVGLEYLTRRLQSVFGLDSFKQGQSEAVLQLVEAPRIHLIVSLPTGFGKSLIFQMAALTLAETRAEVTAVVFPTLPLLMDQCTKLKSFQTFSCGALHSGLKPEEIRKTLVAIKRGLIDVVLVTPEQFNAKRFQTALAYMTIRTGRKVGLLCIDESHCLSEWGHTFRPAYQSVIRNAADIPRILMMTATASSSTLQSMTSAFRQDENLVVYKPQSRITRQDLCCHIIPAESKAQPAELMSLLRRIKGKSISENIIPGKKSKGITLIYCWMKHMAEKVARMIKEEGLTEGGVIYYHSGLDEEERRRSIDAFVKGTCTYCVATEALGIGIDSLFVKTVIHYNMPSGIEQYTQEIGRCNRRQAYGETCHCHLLLNSEDYKARHHQVSASVVDKEAVKDAFLRLLVSSRATDPDHKRKLTRKSTLENNQNHSQNQLKGIVIHMKNVEADVKVSKKIKAASPAIIIQDIDAREGTALDLIAPTPATPPHLGTVDKSAKQMTDMRCTPETNADNTGEPVVVPSESPSAKESTASGKSEGSPPMAHDKDASGTSVPQSPTLGAEAPRSTSPIQITMPTSQIDTTPASFTPNSSGSSNRSSRSSTGAFNEIVLAILDLNDLNLLSDARSADDSQVLLTLLDNLAAADTIVLRVNGRSEERVLALQMWAQMMAECSNELCAGSGDPPAVPGDWLKITSIEGGYAIETSRLKIFQCPAEGVEIRCYDKPLEEYLEHSTLIKFLSQFWIKDSGMYKIKWVDVMMSSDPLMAAGVIDLDVLHQCIYDICSDFHCSVTPINRSNKAVIRFLRSARENESKKYVQRLVQEACCKLEVNNRIQVNRLSSAYVAFKLGQKDPKVMEAFVEDYFTWPSQLESSATDTALFSDEKLASKFDINQDWIREGFEKRPQQVGLAQLKFDIEKLVSALTRDGRYADYVQLSNNPFSFSQVHNQSRS
eukprot:Blabericola_migrator_1__13082@NODE_888_length_6164_cov_126_278498_g625_i0_p1_GENE_NODE_888_length_6164_cov_126_278498_g625_i0NODE_888_length_6164_cov_126_278498_g625_i0_p1_ORF_typecomplete_len1473_score225_05Helicase_C/PF00271_31/5_8e03Helicase_C/PF00271_31/0_26Helicase_C/PF00271_31/2e18DEAD/PF00270_29/9_6e19DEAD/PF00270_29/1_7e03ResIII/PF04851_15/8_2e03ResIII/PF04851_15/6_7e12_NODE_888_length_6164_cov_126_278498_g625_i017046122